HGRSHSAPPYLPETGVPSSPGALPIAADSPVAGPVVCCRPAWNPSPVQTNLHSVVGDLDTCLPQLAAFSRGPIQDRIGIVDVNEDLPLRLERRQLLQHAARPGQRQMPHILGQFAPEPHGGHLVVVPEGAVHHHTIGPFQVTAHPVIYHRQPRCIEKATPRTAILPPEADIVSRLGRVTPWRIRRCVTLQRHHFQSTIFQERNVYLLTRPLR